MITGAVIRATHTQGPKSAGITTGVGRIVTGIIILAPARELAGTTTGTTTATKHSVRPKRALRVHVAA